MSRRERWRLVLNAERERWSAMSAEQLIAALPDVQAYEVEFESQTYQVEVQIIDNTDKHVHVLLGVDDGSLPASFFPSGCVFIREKG